MTVTYSGEVANGSSFGCFWRILCKWRGSVYKLIWRELLAYLCLYFTLNLVYRYAMDDTQQRSFEKVKLYFSEQSESIPMSFVLGFYVSLIVKRWWEQYRLLPWPDSLALFVSAAIPGQDERGRLMRRNIVRYAMLSYVITLQQVSLRVKRRFPTWQHMVDAGLMLESEKKIFDLMDEKSEMSKYWMPLVWATNIINRARKESHIQNDHVVQTMLVELSDIRRRLGSLIGYDTVCVPLVYTQVVTLSVYTYFVAALMGRQWVAPPGSHPSPNLTDAIVSTTMSPPPDDNIVNSKDLDLFFPVFTVLQFCFYIGWLKVAEVLINPFGEDDDDIELNWLIDRHLKAAYMIVDEMHEEHPELLKDQYWEEVVPRELPYTVASEHYRRTEPKGSTDKYKVKESDALYANLLPGGSGSSAVVITTQALVNSNRVNSVNTSGGGHGRKSHSNNQNSGDDVYADYESVDTPLVERRKNWFQRQLHRMGSVRSANTTYSSGGLFMAGAARAPVNRIGNSYTNSGAPQGDVNANASSITATTQKMSLYDRLMSRKSGRGQLQRGRHSTSKMNGSGSSSTVPVTVKNRPRIPTPDVTKESPPVFDIPSAISALTRENPDLSSESSNGVMSTKPSSSISSISQNAVNNTITTSSSGGLFGPSHMLHPILQQQGGGSGSYHGHHSDLPVVQVVLSPIKELDHLPHLPHHPHGTAALAQAVLSPALTSAGIATVLPGTAPPSASSTPPPPTTSTGSITMSSIPFGSVVAAALANSSSSGGAGSAPILTYLPPQHMLPVTHTSCTLSSNTSTTSSHCSGSSVPPLALQLISDTGGGGGGAGGSSESGIGSESGEAEEHAGGEREGEEGLRSRKSSVASQKQQQNKRGEVYV